MAATRRFTRILSISATEGIADSLQVLATTENKTISEIARNLLELGLKAYLGGN